VSNCVFLGLFAVRKVIKVENAGRVYIAYSCRERKKICMLPRVQSKPCLSRGEPVKEFSHRAVSSGWLLAVFFLFSCVKRWSRLFFTLRFIEISYLSHIYLLLDSGRCHRWLRDWWSGDCCRPQAEGDGAGWYPCKPAAHCFPGQEHVCMAYFYIFLLFAGRTVIPLRLTTSRRMRFCISCCSCAVASKSAQFRNIYSSIFA